MLDVRAMSATPHGACVASMLAVVGAVAALRALWRLVAGVWTHFLRPGKELKKLGKWRGGGRGLREGEGGIARARAGAMVPTPLPLSLPPPGKWAVVTGATDGIGRAYADALAAKGGRAMGAGGVRGGGWAAGRCARSPPRSEASRPRPWRGSEAGTRRVRRDRRRSLPTPSPPLTSSPGLNVFLLSRTQAKLDAAAAAIEAAAGVETATLAVDFGKATAADYARIGAALASLDVGVLVNNVGLSYDHAEYYDEISDALVDDLVNVNIQATNKMTKLVLPGMKARRRGAVVCIGSAAATVAPSGPLYAVYAGTKAYVDMFAKSLHLECAKWGVTAQNQAPAYVATKMSKIRKPTLDAPSPAKWVAAAIKAIGHAEPTTTPYWYHGAMWGVVNDVPLAVTNAYLLSFHEWLRARYYKKVAREAAGGSSKKAK
jgi:17beta-estradiol 17-dehydrogenase / very-long-chain 3-oxoacyl-CoA reductase